MTKTKILDIPEDFLMMNISERLQKIQRLTRSNLVFGFVIQVLQEDLILKIRTGNGRKDVQPELIINSKMKTNMKMRICTVLTVMEVAGTVSTEMTIMKEVVNISTEKINMKEVANSPTEMISMKEAGNT